MNEEFTSLLANVLDFVAQVTESLHQTNGMPKLSCFYNRLVQLRKSFGEFKAIVCDGVTDSIQPMIKTNDISPIRITPIHEDLNIFANLHHDDSCEESSSPSEKSF